MTLLPDTFRDWFELFGLVSAVVVLALIGWAVQTLLRLWLDRRREARRPAALPVAAPAVSEPVVAVKSGRSPFAPRREAK